MPRKSSASSLDEANGYMQLSLSARAAPSHRRGEDAIFFKPRDRCSAVYMSLLLCGAGFLLPYNSFIIAVDYYQERFQGSRIVFDMSMLYICVAFFGVLTNNMLVEALHLRTRVTFGYIVAVCVLIVVAVCDVWLGLFQRDVAYMFTLVAVAVAAFASTVQQSSFYGYTSMLPSRYTQAVMTGESLAGVLVSLNRIITKAFLPQSPKMNTLLFFCISILLLLICAVIFHISRRSNFVRYYLNMCKMARLPEHERGFANPCHEELSLVDILDGQSTHAVNHNYGVLTMNTSPSPDTSDTTSNQQCTYTSQGEIDEIFGDPPGESSKKPKRSFFHTNKPVCSRLKEWFVARYDSSKNIYPYMFCICCAYMVTLSLFPGIESEVVSCRLHTWMPVILMAIFNFTDFIGKIIASIKYAWPRGRLFLLTSLRVVLVPLMMMCVMPRSQPLLKHEAWPMTVSALLGLSNGYFGSVPMILAPSRVSDSHREITGNLMTLSYSVGLTSGSGIAYMLDALLGPSISNPCSVTNSTTASVLKTTLPDSSTIFASTVPTELVSTMHQTAINITTTAMTILTSSVLNTPTFEQTTAYEHTTSNFTEASSTYFTESSSMFALNTTISTAFSNETIPSTPGGFL